LSFENIEELWIGMLTERDAHSGSEGRLIDRELIVNTVFRIKLTIPIRALMKI